MINLDNIIGESDTFLTTLDHASRIATVNRPVLLIGERGTGKELIAQRIHYLSPRWESPLVTLNCAALSEGLIDSELFGHESGAFTGAKQRHQGRFERAEQGTLFLDELGTAPLSVQEKLLRVIEYGEYERVGGNTRHQANVRLICATNQSLPESVKAGTFRADLLDRLAFDVIHLPPLRHRQEDILPLSEHYAMKMCQELGFHFFAGFSHKVKYQLQAYSWPGNVRELKNVVERSVFHHNDENNPIHTIIFDPFVSPWDNELPQNTMENHQLSSLPTLPIDLRDWQQTQEIELLKHALLQSHYNQKKAGELLNLNYHQVRGLLRKYPTLSTSTNKSIE